VRSIVESLPNSLGDSRLERSALGNPVISIGTTDYKSIERRVGPKNVQLCTLFIKSYCALLFDSPLADKPFPTIRKFFHYLVDSDLKDVILRYTSLADQILRNAGIGTAFSITGEFVSEMLDTPIACEYVRYYKSGDPSLLQYIISFLFFGKKLAYEDDTFNATAFRKWLEVENDLESLKLQPGLLSRLRVIVAQLLPRLDTNLALPRFGPGFVAEGYIDPNDKIENLVIDDKLSRVFYPRSRYPHGSFVERAITQLFMRVSREEQMSKLMFVPKNIKTARSICQEPNSYMAHQQIVFRWMNTAFKTGMMRHFVTLEDQSINRVKALNGSAYLNYDTLDLSCASDRVSKELVRGIFPKQYWLYLLGTRSGRVRLPDGSLREVKKFAPMGSALCFPVQCVTFTAITLLGYLMHHYGCDTWDGVREDAYELTHLEEFCSKLEHHTEGYSRNLQSPSIYGDDIICDPRVTDRVILLLQTCGLEVNLDKSFTGGQLVRESCGIYAFNGVDVTPVIFRIRAFRKTLDASSFASFIEQINRFGDHRWLHLRSFLINTLRREMCVGGLPQSLMRYLPFTSDRKEFGIYSVNLLKPKTTRVREDWQIEEKKVLKLKNVRGRDPAEGADAYAYLRDREREKARTGGNQDDLNWSSPRVRPSVTRVRLGWTPIRT
jgi:hypothetical protein